MTPARLHRLDAPIYGLRGFDHAGGVLMTLMSADGASSLADRIAPHIGPGLRLVRAPGRLPVCCEVRDGEFARLVCVLKVQLLDFPTWTRTKQALGEVVLR